MFVSEFMYNKFFNCSHIVSKKAPLLWTFQIIVEATCHLPNLEMKNYMGAADIWKKTFCLPFNIYYVYGTACVHNIYNNNLRSTFYSLNIKIFLLVQLLRLPSASVCYWLLRKEVLPRWVSILIFSSPLCHSILLTLQLSSFFILWVYF